MGVSQCGLVLLAAMKQTGVVLFAIWGAQRAAAGDPPRPGRNPNACQSANAAGRYCWRPGLVRCVTV